MPYRLAAVVVALACVLGSVHARQGKKKASDVVKVTATYEKPNAKGEQIVNVTLKIEKPWHLYANPVGNKDLKDNQTTVEISGKDNPETIKVEYPKGKLVPDKDVGDYKVYEGEVTIKATVKRKPGSTGPMEAAVKVNCCSDTVCLLPETLKVTATEKK